jgi:hypothetical protein
MPFSKGYNICYESLQNFKLLELVPKTKYSLLLGEKQAALIG